MTLSIPIVQHLQPSLKSFRVPYSPLSALWAWPSCSTTFHHSRPSRRPLKRSTLASRVNRIPAAKTLPVLPRHKRYWQTSQTATVPLAMVLHVVYTLCVLTVVILYKCKVVHVLLIHLCIYIYDLYTCIIITGVFTPIS